MPTRRDTAPASWDTPAAEDDDEEPELLRRNRPASTSGKIPGITLGKRNGAPVLGGSEPKRQTQIGSLFQQAQKRQQAARLVPAGIVNLGNTCYLNSVIQVLLNMHSFARDLQHPALERLREHLPSGGVCAALQATLSKLRTATDVRPALDGLKPAVEPSELRTAMGRRSGRWRTFAQQDSHEFLVELLEALQSEVLAAEGAVSGHKKVLLSSTRCPAARNLSGCVMHTWTCSACGHCTRAKELFSCLSLQLPPHGSVKLQDMVADYLKDETIEKNCDKCSPSGPVAHTAQHHFWRLPRVLVVHIKRFMALPQQLQQPARQPTPPPQPPLQTGVSGGGEQVEEPAAVSAFLGADNNGDHGPAAPGSAPGTPLRDEHPVPAHPGVSGAGPSGFPAPAQAAPSGPASRDTSPPAQYTYAKVHTVVEVKLGLELAGHCDSAAKAHKHLLEGVPPSALTRSKPADNGGTAEDAAGPAAAAGPVAQTPGGAGAGRKTPARGTPACKTLDTAGGGSTCPSPSFLQPGASALQERTVQQHAVHGVTHPHQRSQLGLTKTPAGKGAGAAWPLDSECGTSAISTGAQADDIGEAPTPHGGLAPRSSPVGTAAKPDAGSGGKRQNKLGGAAVVASGVMRGIVPVGAAAAAGRTGAAATAAAGAAATPHGQLRPGVSGFAGGGHGQPPSCGGHAGHRLSSQNGNDDDAALLQPPGGAARGEAPGSGVAAAAIDAAAHSQRKAPKAMRTGNFFDSAGGGEPPSGGVGSGGREGGGDVHQGKQEPRSSKEEGSALNRPVKHLCVDPPVSSTGKLAAVMRSNTEALRRGIQSSMPPSTPAATPRRLEDMTEEEQLELALRMSLEEEQARVGSSADGFATASDRPGGTGGTAKVDLSVPTGAAGGAAAGGSSDEQCKGKRVRSGAPSVLDKPDGSCEGDAVVPDAGPLDDGDLIELQDESPGGAGGLRIGNRDDCAGRRYARNTTCEPAMSGASGDRGHGQGGDDASGDECIALDPAGDTHPRPRSRSRNDRHNRSMYEAVDAVIVDSAVSPASAPRPEAVKQQQQQLLQQRCSRGRGSGANVNTGLKRSALCQADDEDDGTTALSPVSGSGQRPRSTTEGPGDTDAGPEGGRLTAEGAAAATPAPTLAREDPYALPNDDECDADLEAALRMSMQTFAQEEAERSRREKGGSAPVQVVPAPDAAAWAKAKATGASGLAGGAAADQQWTWTSPSPGKPWVVETGAGAGIARVPTPDPAFTYPEERLEDIDMVWEAPGPPNEGKKNTSGRGAGTRGVKKSGARGPGLPHRISDSDEDVVMHDAQAAAGAGGLKSGEAAAGGSGIDALVAAAGLGAGRSAGDKAAAGAATAGGSGAPAGAHRNGSSGDTSFRFQFPLAESGQATPQSGLSGDAGAGGGGVPGTGRDNPVDLTGCGDDEDAELNKAIMLSLQEATEQEEKEAAWMQALTNDDTGIPMDIDGADASGCENADVSPREKVELQEDSDDEQADEEPAGPEQQQAPPDLAEPLQAASAAKDAAARCQPAEQCSEPHASPSLRPTLASAGEDGSRRREGVPLAQVAKYRLQGVVRHKGLTPFSGHYVADVLIPTPTGQAWFEHNDAVVSHVDFARVREDAEKQGYLFFFVNEATRAAAGAAAPGGAGKWAGGGAGTETGMGGGTTNAAAVMAAALTPLPDDD